MTFRTLGLFVHATVFFGLSESISAQSQYIYWSNEIGVERTTIGRNDRTLIAEGSESYGLAFDDRSQEIYWASRSDVFRSDLDGGNLSQFSFPVWPYALTLDVDGRMSNGVPQFYAESDNEIYRGNLDGSHIQVALVFPNDDPEVYSIAIDFEGQQFFWSVGNS